MSLGSKLITLIENLFWLFIEFMFICIALFVLNLCYNFDQFKLSGLYYILGSILIMILLHCFITFKIRKPTTMDECKKMFCVVSSIKRKGIFALSIFTFIFFMLAVTISIPIDYSKYENAKKYLISEQKLDEHVLKLVDCYPRCLTESIYIEASILAEATDILSSDLSDKEKIKELDILSVRMDNDTKDTRKDLVLLIFLIVIISVFRLISIRISLYHSYMRKLDTKEDSNE